MSPEKKDVSVHIQNKKQKRAMRFPYMRVEKNALLSQDYFTWFQYESPCLASLGNKDGV